VNIGSLFTGYGGLDMAVQATLGGDVAWHSEIDPAPSKILTHHHPDVPNLGDITKIDWATVPTVDVLTGGFPCQDVSHAGKRAGLREGTRSGLWSEFLRAITALRPALVIIENVRGLLSARGDESDELDAADAEVTRIERVHALIRHKQTRHRRKGNLTHDRFYVRDALRIMGQHKRAVATRRWAERRIVRAIGTVLGQLADIGYDARWCGIPASAAGAPHGRFRVFIIAADASGAGAGRDSRAVPRETPRGGRSKLNIRAVGNAGAATTADADSFGVDGPRLHRQGERGGSEPADGGVATTDTERVGPHRETDSPRGRQPHPAGSSRRAEPSRRRETPPSRTIAWGPYEPAIRRWERVLDRPAPNPTEPGAKGQPRLSPAFVEWMMGLPAGWVTQVPRLSRNDQLKALGNGVCPQQAQLALRHLLTQQAAA
jgi:DNA (cytosine-5)-methyltransferase 1